ncbi:MAG: fumarylacetoacetate hydrolase family protein [Flavobacteriales bacterium]|jgi:2-keto-4-pentenoate hydratase/2-oxohepta-3-ene-1,7-dioic acid hydratase in catechol pathway
MKIICIGRNYKDHAAEMKAEVPTEPVIFMKPDTAILKENTFYFPDFTSEVHYECELLVKIDRMGKHIDPEFAHKYYSSFGLGIDFTARDLQQKCKEKGLPWEIAKGFDQSAVISNHWIPKTGLDTTQLTFTFHQNGLLKQEGHTQMMLFTIDQLIAYVSTFITLKTGDIIFTGTPAGVGPIKPGDLLVGHLMGKEMFSIQIA